MQSENLQRSRANGDWISSLLNFDSTEDLRANLQSCYPTLNVRNLKKIAIVGAGPEGVRLSDICRAKGIEILAFTDDHPSKIGQRVAGHVVKPVSELAAIDRATPVVIASHRVLGLTERLRALGFQLVLPFAALQVIAPDLFPPHMFYDGFLDDMWTNRNRYSSLNDQLADQRSRDVLNAVLAFRQTLDPMMLKPVLDDDDLYAPKGLIIFSDKEVYIDGGSYDGDTIRTFMGHVGGRFKHVYAFEPDPITYDKLTANFASEPRIEPIHAGLHRNKGTLRFRNDASRGAIFADDGTIEMPLTTIDDVVGVGPVTYIKMNIEGAEIDALYGGERSIRRELPKLALSVYHRPSDLWQIPEIVKKFSSGYDLYLRQHDGGVIETVLYALHKDQTRS